MQPHLPIVFLHFRSVLRGNTVSRKEYDALHKSCVKLGVEVETVKLALANKVSSAPAGVEGQGRGERLVTV